MIDQIRSNIKGDNGNGDKWKTIGVLVFFIGAIILSLTWSAQSNSKADTALTIASGLEKRIDRLEGKIDHLLERGK